MKIEFGVASCGHMAGAGVNHLDDKRFKDYDSAKDYADEMNIFWECLSTIYLIIDEKYAFWCERSAVKNDIAWVYDIESTDFGQIETRVWWRNFLENPKKFLSLAQGIIE